MEAKDMNIGNMTGIYLGMKLVDGKIKPKYSKHAWIGITLLILLCGGFFGTFLYGIINGKLEFIIFGALGTFSFGSFLVFSPYTQNSNNYYIVFPNENSLVGFQLSYKGKLVDIQYVVDQTGKIAFANDKNKLSCLSYADGSHMSSFVKCKIANYFAKWLNDNNLLSKEVTMSLEG